MLTRALLTVLTFLGLLAQAHAADMPGSVDPAGLPRISESHIIGYEQVDYDAGIFVGADASGKLVRQQPEGRRTRILYLTPEGQSSVAAARNYVLALDALGDVREDFACRGTECKKNTLAKTLWAKDTLPPTEGVKHPYYLLCCAPSFEEPAYRSATVTAKDRTLNVGVWAATVGDNNSNRALAGRTVVLLDVIERQAFEAALEFVDAQTIRSRMSDEGRVALYGVQFDTNEATLKAESGDTMDEIIKALNADKGLRVYVVGHTDDAGALSHNQDLSMRRATTVVDALVSAGIDRSRLLPLGVGPAAPVASNATDIGRALNRRVELVPRL